MLTIAVMIVGFVLVVGVLWLVASRLGVLAPAAASSGEADDVGQDDSAVPVPYVAKERVMSPAEASFHSVLRQALATLTEQMQKDEPPLLLAMVRLADVLVVDRQVAEGAEGARGKSWRAAHNRIDRKQVDFVACNPRTTRPLMVIELDDSSHQRGGRRTRDDFVNRACAAAGLPILRVPAAAGYQVQTLADGIRRAIESAPQPAVVRTGPRAGAK